MQGLLSGRKINQEDRDECYRINAERNDRYLVTTSNGEIAPLISSGQLTEASIYCLQQSGPKWKIYDYDSGVFWKRKTGSTDDKIIVDGTSNNATQFNRHDCNDGNFPNRYGFSDPTDGGTIHLKATSDNGGISTSNATQCNPSTEINWEGFYLEKVVLDSPDQCYIKE